MRITTGWRIALVATPLLLTLATAALAAPGWKPLPPFGGRVLALAAAEGAPLMYAGTAWAGLSRSNNGGGTWLPAQAPGPIAAEHLVVDPRDPRVVFAAGLTLSADDVGVLRSLDGGAHWQPVNQGLSGEGPLLVSGLTFDPFDPRKLYAATTEGLFQTRNRGASWQQVSSDGQSIVTLAADPFRPGVLFAWGFLGEESSVLVSHDGGATWEPSSQGIEGHPVFDEIIFHPTSPNTLFALGKAWPTYVSRDSGATWTKLGQSLVSLAFGPGGSLFGAPYDTSGVLKSVDGGLTWSQTGPLDRVNQVLRVNGRFYAAGDLGVWVSNDNGAHWRPSSRGLSARPIGDLTEAGSGLYGSFAPEGVLASRTGGTSWQLLRDTDHPQGFLLRFLAAGPDAIYALEQDITITIIRSTDGGASWSELTDPGLGGSFSALAVDPQHPATLYAGAAEITGRDVPPCHLARSVDAGRTWSCVAEAASVVQIAVERATSTPYLIAAGDMFALVGGTTLESRSTGLPFNGTTDFAFDRRRPGTLYAATREGLFKTIDGGKSWAKATRGLPAGEAYSVAVDPHRRDVVYVGFEGRVYRSLNAGRTWQPFGNGLPDEAPIVDLLASATNPRRLYAVVEGRGLFWQER